MGRIHNEEPASAGSARTARFGERSEYEGGRALQGCERELGLAHACRKAFCDGRQGGQIQVGGDGLQAKQQRQEQDHEFLGHVL